MKKPVEIEKSYPIQLQDDKMGTTADVREMFLACIDGDLEHVMEILSRSPALLTCKYDYTRPIFIKPERNGPRRLNGQKESGI